MGLFRKKTDDTEHIEALRAELRAMTERLNAADADKVRLEQRLVEIDSENQLLASQVGTIDTKVGTVEHRVGTFDELRSDVQRLTTRVTTPPTEPPPPPPAPIQQRDPRVDEVEARLARQLEELTAVVDEQREQLTAALQDEVDGPPRQPVDDELRREVGRIAERMTALDGRVTRISLELTNQLTELSGELDGLAEADPTVDTSAIDEKLDDITSGQERLAKEQARYEIQFREDLAELADRLRRPTTR